MLAEERRRPAEPARGLVEAERVPLDGGQAENRLVAGGEETALVKDGCYLILNGDWREQYEAVFDEGYDACLKLYLQNKDTYRSSWSSDTLDDLLNDGEAE